MNASLKIGRRVLNSDQIMSALIQYQMMETLIGEVIVDAVIHEVALTPQEVFCSLGNSLATHHHAAIALKTHPTEIEDPEKPSFQYIPDELLEKQEWQREDFERWLGQWCRQRNIAPEYLKAVILRDLRVQKFKQTHFADQVESEFLRHQSELNQVEFSLIQVDNAALAQELYFQLRDDRQDFAQCARHYSLGQEQQTGGWVGPVSLSTLPEEVAIQFQRGAIGQLYEPIPIAQRFWLVRLENKINARLTAATRSLLINRLYHNWLHGQIQAARSTPGAIALQAALSEGGEQGKDEGGRRKAKG